MPRNTNPTKKVIDLIKERAGEFCEFPHCFSRHTVTHHRRPRRMGGDRRPDTNQPPNLVRICDDHHNWIERLHRAEAQRMGLLLHSGAMPALVPALLRPGWVYLDNDGDYMPDPDHGDALALDVVTPAGDAA